MAVTWRICGQVPGSAPALAFTSGICGRERRGPTVTTRDEPGISDGRHTRPHGHTPAGTRRPAARSRAPCGLSGLRRGGTADLPDVPPAVDARLALPAGTPLGLGEGPPDPLLQLEWCAPFTGTLRRALHALKYAGERRLARPLGEAIAARWRHAGAGGDIFVPIPVHAARRRERGYDQAELIAAAAAGAMPMPWLRLSTATGRRPRSTTSTVAIGRPTSRTRSRPGPGRGARRGALGRARRRRRHDRRDAVRGGRGAPRGWRPGGERHHRGPGTMTDGLPAARAYTRSPSGPGPPARPPRSRAQFDSRREEP